MARSTDQPDRLATLLAELQEGRRRAWVPQEDDLVDRRPLLHRFHRAEPATGGLADLGFAGDSRPPSRDPDEFDDEPLDDDLPDEEPVSRADRRARGLPGRDVRPHAPLFRSPLGDTAVEAHPARAALIGALLVVVVVAMVLAVRVWTSGRAHQPVPLADPPTTSATGSRAASSTASATGSAGATARAVGGVGATQSAGGVEVHVVGQVRHPGVVTLRSGARVIDAIKAAGGALPGADLDAVNLARVLGDGEQVRVPKPGETLAPSPPTVAGGGGAGTGGTSADAPAAGPVNLNTADAAALDGLPGVGPVLAERILQWRQTNGRFTSVDELGEVSGIGDKALERLRPLVTV